MKKKNRYPENWPEIAERIKRKNNYCCEVCGHKHEPETGYCLGVHHLDRDKENNEDYNLVSACQRCHLRLEAQAMWLEKWGFTVFEDTLFVYQPITSLKALIQKPLFEGIDDVDTGFPDWYRPHWEGYLESLRKNNVKAIHQTP